MTENSDETPIAGASGVWNEATERALRAAAAEAAAATREQATQIDSQIKALWKIEFGSDRLLAQMNSALDVLRKNAFANMDLSSIIQVPAFKSLSRVNPMLLESIRNRQLYSTAAPKLFHSSGYTGPADYYSASEVVIDSFDDLSREIGSLMQNQPNLPLVWRGVRDANWGFHSSLYRALSIRNGVVDAADSSATQPYPTEAEMVEAEAELLDRARRFWRFDDMSALEIFARVQHVGGPTRLIDVTRNPYIGAWFAVEEDQGSAGADARLFALATHPVTGDSDHTVQMDDFGAAREPFWHGAEGDQENQLLAWGAGSLRRVWFPPVYDNRILAQNAGFVFDGVPISIKGSYFKKTGGGYFTKGDLLSAGSIYMKMYRHDRPVRPSKPGFSPSFSFRITAEAKKDIRETLQSRFGYRASSIYPDAQGLSSFMTKKLSTVVT